ncbi:MAG: hypothetical protein ACJAYC_001746 [Halieaceae bacterium]|jgi:hypothetical protein
MGASTMKKRVSLILLVLLLAGCSSTTFVYNRLDFLLPWYLGDYVNLDRQQKKHLDEILKPFLSWHRAEELPVYLAILDDVRVRLEQPVSADDVMEFSSKVEAAWFRLEEEALDWLLSLGDQLSDQQMAEFIAELRAKQVEYEEEYLPRSDEEYREEASDNLRDNLQDYLGRLEPEQSAILQVANKQLIRSDAAWLLERARWLDTLQSILQRDSGWQQRLSAAIADRDENVSQEYNDTFSHNLSVIQGAITDVLSSRTPKQDKRLKREIDGLREDLETLIQQGQKTSAEAA